jgi:DNA helicase-2/ATP-dependent DNA helicase PcrA
LEAAKIDVPTEALAFLSVQTFHSFFWSLLKSHAYLLGAPRRLTVMLPHDEKAANGGIDDRDDDWAEWLAERERLFHQQGRVVFDLFAPYAAEIFGRCDHVLRQVAEAYPLVIVDEAQDTGAGAWRCVQLLAAHTQVLCLADLEQQIYDWLPGVGPERIAEIRSVLDPFEVDLGSDNGRSPDTEILAFANDVLMQRPRGTPYRGVQLITYEPRTVNWNVLLRRSLKAIFEQAEEAGRSRPETIAVLTDSTRNALRVSNALHALGDDGGKSVPHKLHFDEAEALLVARLAAFLLEPKDATREREDIATCIELLASAKRATGKGRTEVAKLLQRAGEVRAGTAREVNLIKAIRNLLTSIRSSTLSGDPAADWLFVKRQLRMPDQAELSRAAQQLDFMVAFRRGHRISAALAEVWLQDGAYTNARAALDMALVQEQILESAEVPLGIHVMNWHKAKAKQFDAVILVREVRFGADGRGAMSSFVWRDDQPPFEKSRRLVRVAATRARQHLLLLSPNWPVCPLLRGHSL